LYYQWRSTACIILFLQASEVYRIGQKLGEMFVDSIVDSLCIVGCRRVLSRSSSQCYVFHRAEALTYASVDGLITVSVGQEVREVLSRTNVSKMRACYLDATFMTHLDAEIESYSDDSGFCLRGSLVTQVEDS
jgi:hypothetical protein